MRVGFVGDVIAQIYSQVPREQLLQNSEYAKLGESLEAKMLVDLLESQLAETSKPPAREQYSM